MTISNSHVLNCRVNAPGLWPLTISLGATPSILLQLGGGLYSGQTVTTEIRTRSACVSPFSSCTVPLGKGEPSTTSAKAPNAAAAVNGVINSRPRRHRSAGVTGGERAAQISAGPAHGEHPVVNGKAGVLSAQGSTPPSSTNSSQQTSTSQQQGEKP